MVPSWIHFVTTFWKRTVSLLHVPAWCSYSRGMRLWKFPGFFGCESFEAPGLGCDDGGMSATWTCLEETWCGLDAGPRFLNLNVGFTRLASGDILSRLCVLISQTLSNHRILMALWRHLWPDGSGWSHQQWGKLLPWVSECLEIRPLKSHLCLELCFAALEKLDPGVLVKSIPSIEDQLVIGRVDQYGCSFQGITF